jgi:hypothetical protein
MHARSSGLSFANSALAARPSSIRRKKRSLEHLLVVLQQLARSAGDQHARQQDLQRAVVTMAVAELTVDVGFARRAYLDHPARAAS